MALLPIAEALARVIEGAEPLPAESVALADAEGRVLAEDLVARRTQPPDDVSAMDGYAVRGEDVATAPARLRLIGEVAAGRPLAAALQRGEAARIFTGGVLPQGSDTVVIQENTTRDGNVVVIHEPATRGKNVRIAGLDFRQGHVGLRKGRRLTGRDVSLAAAMNHAHIPVVRAPKIAIAATGDELVPPGTEPEPGQIVYSNLFALAAVARREGAQVIDLGILPDRLEETIAGVRRARDAGADVLLTTGGASVGDYDLVQPALAAEGLALAFWKVAVRPGKPLLSGRLGAMRVLGLPGNPVSSYVCCVLFLVPLIRKLLGRADFAHVRTHGVLGRDLKPNDEREDYLRATLARRHDGTLVATPFPQQDSSMLVPLAAADCLLIRPPHAPAAAAGAACEFITLRD
ncbi:MAG: molybdopterin molybdotransferase MoeA [Alphaproteobacteria bacterium]|nr:molybdopterin molybdotransferase MoeA [Alphaproteobacteria bacterium]